MIDFSALVVTFFAKKGLESLLNFVKGNEDKLQKLYKDAFEKTVEWYENEFGDKFGKSGTRFYDYQTTEAELAKMLFLRTEPDVDLIRKIKFQPPIKISKNVVLQFVEKLRHELRQIRECEAILVEKESYFTLKAIRQDTAHLPNIDNILQNIDKKFGKWLDTQQNEKKTGPKPEKKIPASPINPADLQNLFTEVYHLDRLDYGHLGTQRDNLQHKLELARVYVGLNVKFPANIKLQKIVKKNQLTFRQQQNLPLLLQGLSDLFRIEEERKKQPIDLQEGPIQLHPQMAEMLLKEADAKNLRSFKVILRELQEQSDLNPEDTTKMLRNLCDWGFAAEPLARVPKQARAHLVIGDAGSGKSTASRYLAWRCFEALKMPEDTFFKKEFALKGATPLPIYLRLEDFGKLADTCRDGQRNLLECAANFWCVDGKPLFSADDLALTLQTRPVWLLLDGLDELSHPDQRRKLAEAVQAIIRENQYPELRITLTTRPAVVSDELLNTLNLPVFYLLDLKPQQLEQFAENYFKANLTGETEQAVEARATKFLSALNDVPAARKLATNPLLLTVIAVLHYKEDKLPESRAELYEKCIEQLMAQRATTPGKLETGKIDFQFPKDQPKRLIDWGRLEIQDFLRQLAFYVLQSSESDVFLTPEFVRRRLLETDISERAKESGALEGAARAFLDESDRKLGLLAFRGGHYVFVHRTFQEYLAAHWLSLKREKFQEQALAEMIAEPDRWREVILLYFNRIGRTSAEFGTELLQDLLQPALAADDPERIELIARCLAEFEESRPRQSLHQTIKTALETRRDQANASPEIFLTCGDALGLIHEPKIDVADPPMVRIPAGEFQMGSDEGGGNEKPIHPIKISEFWLGKYPVTNGEFAEFIRQKGYETETYWFDTVSRFSFDARDFFEKIKKEKRDVPAYWLDKKLGKERRLAPVVGVSWYEARAYCRWWTLTFAEKFAAKHGMPPGYLRLPTEAEWEYACRAGTTTTFNTGDNLTTNQANYDGNYPWKNFPKGRYLGRTTAVGSFAANAWGLCDMHGNVYDWCQDGYSGDYYEKCKQQGVVANPTGPESSSGRVLRGGCWDYIAQRCRSAYRDRNFPADRSGDVGFRLVFVP